MFKIGDRVKVNGKYYIKTVTAVDFDSNFNVASYEVDGEEGYLEEHLEPATDEEIVRANGGCSCGVNTTYGKSAPAEFHSDWCALYKARK